MVIVPIIAVIRMKDFLPFRSVVSTVYVRWTAIKIQIVRMERVGITKANKLTVKSQAFCKIKKNILLVSSFPLLVLTLSNGGAQMEPVPSQSPLVLYTSGTHMGTVVSNARRQEMAIPILIILKLRGHLLL